MSRAVNRKTLIDACINGILTGQDLYKEWTGANVRAAPESLVQVLTARHLAESGVRLLLEAQVRELAEAATEERPIPITRQGRIDIAVFYDSGAPRLFIEVKKISNARSLNEDHSRIVELLRCCSKAQHGVMIGYTTAVKASTVIERLKAVQSQTGCRVVRSLAPVPVKTRAGRNRYLGGAVLRVDRGTGVDGGEDL